MSGTDTSRELAVPLGGSQRLVSQGHGQAPEHTSSAQGPSEQFNYVAPEVRALPPVAKFLRKHLFRIFLILTVGGTVIILVIKYFLDTEFDTTLLGLPCSTAWRNLLKYLSIPVVSIAFTWWHVWLGIQMVFYPVEFVGCCRPVFGWQGIVPRRAEHMARRCCDIMIGSLITLEEVIDRIKPEDFFENLNEALGATTSAVLSRLANRHCPDLWAKLPQIVKEELQAKTLEESQLMFNPVIKDLKANVHQILDIKQMAIDVLVENKSLLVKMFRDIGAREFLFIQHVAAVMGFLLGVVQMILWLLLHHDGELNCRDPASARNFRCWGGFVILPVSGLVIGYFTNWLAITMIFRPVEPHIICCGYVNIQGMFLKRQQQVSHEMSTMVCENLITARKMMEYVIRRQETIDSVLEIFQGHMRAAVDAVVGKTLGPAKVCFLELVRTPHGLDENLLRTFLAQVVAPIFVGRGAIEGIKDDVVRETLAELPHHYKEIESYVDRSFALRDTLSYRLSRLAPDRFEGMLHPVFQEDEWMVLLLGGVLGVVVGCVQAVLLRE